MIFEGIFSMCCMLPLLLVIVVAVIVFLLRTGGHYVSLDQMRRNEPVSMEETCYTSLNVEEAFKKLEDWARQKRYKMISGRFPRYMTIKPGLFAEKLDIELREQENGKVMIRGSSSGKRINVEMSMRALKDYFAMLPP